MAKYFIRKEREAWGEHYVLYMRKWLFFKKPMGQYTTFNKVYKAKKQLENHD